MKKTETLRIKIYSVKGNYDGSLYGLVDVEASKLDYNFWFTLLSGKAVPNAKKIKENK